MFYTNKYVYWEHSALLLKKVDIFACLKPLCRIFDIVLTQDQNKLFYA